MKRIKSIIAVALTVLMLNAITPVAFADRISQGDAYVISNPYADVNWETVNQYKASLHNHTNASDGDNTLRESLEHHAKCNYDIVAITDHGTVNYSWAEKCVNKVIYGVLKLIGKSEGELDYLGTTGSFADGTTYELVTENGDDYLKLSTGKTILRVPFGNEQNALSANAHVNSWFADFTQNALTTYIDAVKGVEKNDGVCVINHPGEYSKARYELHSSEAYNENTFCYRYLINKWARLIEKYDSCIGIDINSKWDKRTRFDRILWDNLLKRFSANGENVFAIASADSHQLDKIDTGFVLALMQENTGKNFKACLKNGEFFAASHCIGNYDELVDIATAIKKYYGETAIYSDVNSVALQMADRVKKIENGELDADDDIDITWQCIDNDTGLFTAATSPEITSIEVDDSENTIDINTENALIVRYISDGKLIATVKADDGKIDLDDYAGEIGNYVRAEVFGEGGVIYTQAFLLNASTLKGGNDVVDKSFVDLGIFDCLFPMIKNWKDILSRK